MRNPVFTSAFKQDWKLVKKRGYDITELQKVIDLLINEMPLPAKYRDHQLIGNLKSHRELHIGPDWLLIYKISGQDCIFAHTGTHTDLFD